MSLIPLSEAQRCLRHQTDQRVKNVSLHRSKFFIPLKVAVTLNLHGFFTIQLIWSQDSYCKLYHLLYMPWLRFLRYSWVNKKTLLCSVI